MKITRINKKAFVIQAYCPLCQQETTFKQEHSFLFRCSACWHAVKDFASHLGFKKPKR